MIDDRTVKQSASQFSSPVNYSNASPCEQAFNSSCGSRIGTALSLQPYPTTMRATRVHHFGGPDVLTVNTGLPVPPLVQPSQVLVKLMCAGVNPIETYIREGQYSKLPDLPYTPGSDGAGIVSAVGSAVKSVTMGQRVFVTGPNSGSYAEYVICDEYYVFPLHPRLSYAQGAALGIPYFTAYKALVLGAKAKPAELVLIHGASGAVGTAAVQIARSIGCTVVGTAGTREGMDVVARCGAHHVFNHNHKGYEKRMIEHVVGSVTASQTNAGKEHMSCCPVTQASSSPASPSNFTSPTAIGGFDVIIEHLANINLGQDLQMLNPGARVMIVGCRGAVTINPRHLMLPEARIMGIQLGSSTTAEYRKMGSAIVAAVEIGALSPVINREYDMLDVRQVHSDIVQMRGAKGKLVLRISSDADEPTTRNGMAQTAVHMTPPPVECHCQDGVQQHSGHNAPQLRGETAAVDVKAQPATIGATFVDSASNKFNGFATNVMRQNSVDGRPSSPYTI